MENNKKKIMTIEDLDLSIDLENNLYNCNINTLSDLLKTSINKLSLTRLFAYPFLKELVDACKKYDIPIALFDEGEELSYMTKQLQKEFNIYLDGEEVNELKLEVEYLKKEYNKLPKRRKCRKTILNDDLLKNVKKVKKQNNILDNSNSKMKQLSDEINQLIEEQKLLKQMQVVLTEELTEKITEAQELLKTQNKTL